MTITHHVSDEYLYLYAAGQLAYGWNVAIASHLTYCPHCRAKVEEFELVLASDLEDQGVLSLPKSDFDAVMSRIEDAPDAPAVKAKPVASSKPVFPAPLRELAGDLDDIQWSIMGGGIKQKILHRDGGLITRLLYIPAGRAASAHGHKGIEMTQVVKGGYFDGEKAFRCGDIQIVAHASPHQPIAMAGEDCVCLAVTDAPLSFRNVLPRLFQRFFQI